MATGRTLPLLLPHLENLTSISLGYSEGGAMDWSRVSRIVKNALRVAFALPGLSIVVQRSSVSTWTTV